SQVAYCAPKPLPSGGSGGTSGGAPPPGQGCGTQACCPRDQCAKGYTCAVATQHCTPVSTAQCGTLGSNCCVPTSASPACGLGGECIPNVCQPWGGHGEVCCHGINTAGGTCNLGSHCNGATCS